MLTTKPFLFAGTTINVATFGVGMSAFYFMPRFPERGGQIALNILIYNFVAGWIPLIVLAIYPGVLQLLFHASVLQPLAMLLSVLVLFTLTSILLQQIPTAMQDVRSSTIFIVGAQVSKALMLAATALMFWFGEEPDHYLHAASVRFDPVSFWYLHGRFPLSGRTSTGRSSKSNWRMLCHTALSDCLGGAARFGQLFRQRHARATGLRNLRRRLVRRSSGFLALGVSGLGDDRQGQ